MYPRKFEYIAPPTVEEAVAALAANPGAKVMAGGMSLLPLMKMRLFSPPMIVDIGRIGGLDRIEDRGDHLAIGALVRHAQTAESPLVREHAAALATAAGMTGDAQVRNWGTTCGSLAHADIAADQPAAALAVGATLVVQGPNGRRDIAVADCFVDTLTTSIQPDEVVVELKVPKAGGASAYDKLGRRGGHSDYAVAGAAAWVQRSNGTIEAARVALTGVAAKPQLVTAVADAIAGTDGSAAAIEEAASHAVDGVTVLEDLYGSEDYKAHLATVYVARSLAAAIGG
ncbi:MAG: xanthine dehydrogenase family protein subunit M [Actinobacteria bacterium]|nr:MAG: xanthine dehydrogenase family protein subunit M [Actinomycetota bacterium]